MGRFARGHRRPRHVRPRASMVIIVIAVLIMVLSGCAVSRFAGVSQPNNRGAGGHALPGAGSSAGSFEPGERTPGDDAEGPSDLTVRFMTYNIHWGLGTDGVHDLDRIVDVLRRVDADVVVLTEVDVNWRRSGNVDQPAYLARAADYPYWYFGRALKTWASGGTRQSEYGNLILSRFPIVRAQTVPLPGPVGREPRSAAVVDVRIGDELATVVGAHFGLNEQERLAQAAHVRSLIEIASAQPSGRADYTTRSVILMGDFNARPSSAEIELLTKLPGGLVDTHLIERTARTSPRNITRNSAARVDHRNTGRPDVDMFDVRLDGNTFPYPDPYARIDYIFVSPRMARHVIFSGPLLVAGSDHLPVIADITWPRQGSRGSTPGLTPGRNTHAPRLASASGSR